MLINNPNYIPEWIPKCIKYLLPKTDETDDPKNYRPISCLTTINKMIPSVLMNSTYTFLDGNHILIVEESEYRRVSYGCKDQRLINKTILEKNGKKRCRNLSRGWRDYR